MDNFYFKMTCEGKETLRRALELAARSHKVVGYAVRAAVPEVKDAEKPYLDKPAKPQRMVFFWSASGVADLTPFPFPMGIEQAADFAHEWLGSLNYGQEPDHDGDNGKGWTVYCEGWGHVDSEYQAFIAVAPSWAMYGK